MFLVLSSGGCGWWTYASAALAREESSC